MRVTCRVILPGPHTVLPGARVHVRAEDVSLQDVAARRLTSVTVPAKVEDGELAPIVIEFSSPRGGSAAIRVHIDQNGDGVVRVGDLVSTARHEAARGSDRSAVRSLWMDIPVTVVTG